MPRIRTVKPEFWDSPSTAKASPWARLLFIAMWNWADDFGRGTANIKELEGFAFPNDDTFTDRSGNTVNFRELVAEVSECFGVVLYEVDGRPYFAIPTWDSHQRNEKRAKQSKYPPPPASPQVTPPVAESHGISATPERKTSETPRSSGTGTGDQGAEDQGAEEQEESVIASDPDPPRPDVEKLLDLLDEQIEANGNRAPKRNKANRDAMRLLLDRDEYSVEQVEWIIEWCQRDQFWQANILSASKLRQKFNTLVAQARVKSGPSQKENDNMRVLSAFAGGEL